MQDSKIRVPSSEEEEKSTVSDISGFASLLTRENEEPTTFNPDPADESELVGQFRELVDSSDPVQSDRSSWCLRRELDSTTDNWQRTAKHFRLVFICFWVQGASTLYITFYICQFSRDSFSLLTERKRLTWVRLSK